jgi:gas vesicle protein
MRNRSNDSDGNSLITPLLIGLTLGAFAGVLLAPEKGSVLREKIIKGKREVKEKLNGGLEYAQSIAEDAEDFAYKHYNELTKVPVKNNVAELAFMVVVAGVALGALFGTDKFKKAAIKMMREVREQRGSLRHMLLHKN